MEMTKGVLTKMPVNKDLGQLIRQHRLEAGITLPELAARIGIHKGSLHRIEAGGVAQPKPELLQRVATALGTEVEDYMALADYAVGLPSLTPYLRAKYEATPDEAAQVETYFRFLRRSRNEQISDDTDHDQAVA